MPRYIENYHKKLFYDFFSFYLEEDMGNNETRGMFFFTLTKARVCICYNNFSEKLLVLQKSLCSFLPHIFTPVWGKNEQFFLPQIVFIFTPSYFFVILVITNNRILLIHIKQTW